MRRRLGALVASAGLAAVMAIGAGSTAAVAGPPGFISIGWYGTLADCVAAAQANYPVHGPVYICERHGSLYQLWMH